MDNLTNEFLIQIFQKLRLEDLQVSQRICALRRIKLVGLAVRFTSLDYLTKKKKLVTCEVREISDKGAEGFGIYFTVMCPLFINHDIAEVERVLEQMWKTVWILLRHCNTTCTDLCLQVPDFYGVFMRQLLKETTENPALVIHVEKLTVLSIELYGIIRVVRCKSLLTKGWKKHGLLNEAKRQLPKSKSPSSSLSLWQFCHESDVADFCCEATSHELEPKWTVDKLLDLIKTWQLGRAINYLDFSSYAYERGEREKDMDLFNKTVKAVKLKSLADNPRRFEIDTSSRCNPGARVCGGSPMEHRVIEIANVSTTPATRLHVRFFFTYEDVAVPACGNNKKRKMAPVYKLESVSLETPQKTGDVWAWDRSRSPDCCLGPFSIRNVPVVSVS